jgi:hypothetical protein
VSVLNAALLRAANLGAIAFGPRAPHDAGELIKEATDGAGLTPADHALAAEPLQRLLSACAEEASLSTFGRVGLRYDALRHLRNLRRLADEEAQRPAILAAPITAPLFITGLPRSGTSFLHRLLAADPAARAPRAWQTSYPYPDSEGPDRRAARVQHQLDVFALLAPGLRSVHPINAQSPQECTEITSHVFRSLRFETVYRIPSYKGWLEQEGHEAAYRFHRRFLQHLQHAERSDGPPRWVLKCPDHVFGLSALRAAYPDARLVFLHRDPLKVLPSVAQLTEVLRTPFARRIDRSGIGRQVADDWVKAAGIMLKERQSPTFPSEQTLHISYRDVVGRPVETIAMIYDHFSFSLTDAARTAMATYIAAEPRGGYGANRYSFDRHGLDPAELRARFAAYVAAFGVDEEAPAAPARPSPPRKIAAPQLTPVVGPPHASP